MADKKSEKRNQLIQKLNEDLNDYISNLKPKKYEEGWAEDKWEEEMEKHPVFRTQPIKEGEEVSPLIEALQQLKYDPNENTPEELAKNYKEDGNENFRLKKYRWAIDCYSEGLKQNCQDADLRVQLFTNRAAAHFHLGNYRSSLNDAIEARTLKTTHMKAIVRGSLCFFELKLYKECIEWCSEGLAIDKENETLKELKINAMKLKKLKEQEMKQKSLQNKKDDESNRKLKQAIMERGIKIKPRMPHLEPEWDIHDLETSHPAAKQNVHLDKDNNLIWPVYFLYPEFAEMDFIQEFGENTRFFDHLKVMFGSPENRPEWDKTNSYIPEKLQIYFEYSEEDCLVSVNKNSTLQEILRDDRYWVKNGTPAFIIMVQNSEFEKDFRGRYKKVL
ncbi:tetratricopeptide repeat protein 4-like [Centruroides sculpturatus]|uniref:tetratricopeptide repeat protein 4-like n=1 Tax=Centruroides sculpturatus TaxID=218467 RepID=UPI000C6D1909|nr:tetratricopeptide repeat protein 4-like [Centruroides sculpturatus]XP_023217002.1 tetratricopeptide repeat protein 4-like [Centruroides sculpturatus]XP_023217003.1 tetratricopeptide repeat protein 4-like [Centruroides sculpturatus]XP_023217005.1 tetratricopeptide repeat protein 4-like [Centruroides sculpturatus]